MELDVFIEKYLSDTKSIIDQINQNEISKIIKSILKVKKNKGRLFFIGSGGGAGHASHAVNDFRKIAGIESYSPSDNISELTARINDDGWESSYSNILLGNRLNSNDGIFIFSVGGGNKDLEVSTNIISCIDLAIYKKCEIMGIVGRDGGYLSQVSKNVCIIPSIDKSLITPHTEGWQAVIWHLIVSHPEIQEFKTKW